MPDWLLKMVAEGGGATSAVLLLCILAMIAVLKVLWNQNQAQDKEIKAAMAKAYEVSRELSDAMANTVEKISTAIQNSTKIQTDEIKQIATSVRDLIHVTQTIKEKMEKMEDASDEDRRRLGETLTTFTRMEAKVSTLIDIKSGRQ